MDNTVATDRLSQMGLRVYSGEEIKKLSVKEIRDPQQFDNLQLPTIGGLYDPALGCTRNEDVCATCGQSGRYCPGHMGHIDLALPVFNPVFFKMLFKILKATCLSCHRLYLKDEEGVSFVCQMRLLEKGFVLGARRVQEYALSYKAEKEEAFDSFKEELFSNLENMVKGMMEEDTTEGAAQCTKMVHAEISLLVNDTMKLLADAPQRCPHCKARKLRLQSEYFNRITASGSLGKTDQAKGTDKRKSIPGKTGLEADPEEDNEVEHLLKSGRGQCLIMPHLAKQIVRKVLAQDGKVLRKLFRSMEELGDDQSATDMFFLTAVLVPPSRFRPLSVMGDKKFENQQTASLSRVLTDNCEIRQLLTKMNIDVDKSTDLTEQQENGTTWMDNLRSLWIQLQSHVNALIDSDLDKLSPQSSKLQGVRQVLEKKEGLFRMHMMGKRVNYAARSVISPDVCINTNEIGVPAVFAQKLTYPQPVTPWNVHELRQYVINGPNTYPGASAVVNEDGSVTKLNPTSETQRKAVAKQLLTPSDASGRNQLPKQVLRHLKNGDVMLLNRQPTLHRPSIQAHKARVLPGLKTLRLHYSNCKAYNADFDGDEMNAHFPQSELCRAEAYGIASTDFQYLVPKDGAPLAGLIQDHLVAGVALTVRGQFLTRDDYCNLLQAALADKKGRIQLLPPAIVKPGPLWAGKQIISTLLLNIIPKDKPPLSLDSKTKISEKSWVRGQVQDPWRLKVSKEELAELGESTVLVSEGELMQGVLDKAQCGPSSFGLVHYVYELYGGEVAGQLLTCLGRLFTAFLKLRGFTLGVEDILVKDKADGKRTHIISKSAKKGHKAALEAFGRSKEDCSDAELLQLLRKAHFSEDDFTMQQLDMTAKKVTFSVQDDIAMKTMAKDLYKSFPDNNLQLMVQSGAKGSSVNCMQISCLLGQIELEGRRPPLMQSGRSLPSFTPYDLTLRSRGFVTGRFLTGIRPQEYFFHCMAGREGLVDTAVKTSRSGYLQRCLIKHLEGLSVHYDMTVRDSDGSVIQFLYGEDGLEVAKTSLLQEKQLPFLLKNQQVFGSSIEHATKTKPVEKHKKKISKWQKKHQRREGRTSGFLDFCSRQSSAVVNGDAEVSKATGRSAHSKVLEVEWRALDSRQRHKFLKKHRPCPDPVLSKFWPQQCSGVLSEKMQKSLNLIQKQLQEVGRTSQDQEKAEHSIQQSETLTKLVNYKVMRSLCDPGEAVGVLCAQSLGEQTTQMTLNTFHFAGRGEMNVTMGIPRLREVLMTASSTILTPSMDIPVLDTPQATAAAKQLQMRMNRVHLYDVLQDVETTDSLKPSSAGGSAQRLYRVRFVMLPQKAYSDKLEMKPKQVVKLMEDSFIGRLGEAIFKAIRKQSRVADSLVSQTQARGVEQQQQQDKDTDGGGADDAAAAPADDADSDVEANDGDASTVRELQRHSDMQEYEGEEEEKEEVGDSTQAEEMEVQEETPQDEDESGQQEKEDTEAEGSDIAKVKAKATVHDYKRDRKGKWCEVVYEFKVQPFLVNIKSIVEKEAKNFTVQSVPGIKRCMLIERSDDDRFKGQKRLYLVTEGINLMEMMKHCGVLELNAMYTNSIVDIQNTYGIEAANKAVIKEVQKVFKAYNIQVSYRHLSLLADYMTCEGQYKGFNRNAITSNPSPLQKITFETSTNFLVNACLNAWPDRLQSPSAQIVAGRVVSSGTGSFDILQPLKV
ncbi:DNA-directed RNA polymerase I subunit RPA1-like [Babylonia areolata]|uniref:DNA-directed RNA polymerase I subunit RPA1-like n=1 Tax=Babylonia areolata TaxID=304850 RepID=UPI003FD56941